jgi:hypothetical protein
VSSTIASAAHDADSPVGRAATVEDAETRHTPWRRRRGSAAPPSEGIDLTFCPKEDNRLIKLLRCFEGPALAIDVRLQSATWMRELDACGASVVVEREVVGGDGGSSVDARDGPFVEQLRPHPRDRAPGQEVAELVGACGQRRSRHSRRIAARSSCGYSRLWWYRLSVRVVSRA